MARDVFNDVKRAKFGKEQKTEEADVREDRWRSGVGRRMSGMVEAAGGRARFLMAGGIGDEGAGQSGGASAGWQGRVGSGGM